MNRLVATRKQREAVYRLFARYYEGITTDLANSETVPPKLFPNKVWWNSYRSYRRRFQFSGFCGDYYLFGQPYTQGEGQLYVGIEADGYTHS